MSNITGLQVEDSMWPNGVVVPPATLEVSIFKGVVFATSAMLVCFYFYQYMQNRCAWEVAYVQFVTAINYGLGTFAPISLTVIVLSDGRFFAIGRYFGWLATCPVILIQLYALMAFYGPPIDPHSVYFTVIKDLCMTTCGILAAVTADFTKKWILYCVGCFLCLWLFHGLLELVHKRKQHFPKQTHSYLVGIVWMTIITWSSFPLMFLLGFPGLNVVGYRLDVIATSIGDLFSKCFAGLFTWNIRWNIIEPLLQKENRTTREPKVKPIKAQDWLLVGKPKRHMVSLRVLIIDANSAYQRLLELLLQKIDGESIGAFDIRGARKVLMRQSIDEIDVVLVNMAYFRKFRNELLSFKMQFGSHPVHVPLLGYTMQPANIQLFKSQTKGLCDDVIENPLDTQQLESTLRQWKKASAVWKDISTTSGVDRNTKGLDSLDNDNTLADPSQNADLAHILIDEYNSLLAPPGVFGLLSSQEEKNLLKRRGSFITNPAFLQDGNAGRAATSNPMEDTQQFSQPLLDLPKSPRENLVDFVSGMNIFKKDKKSAAVDRE